MKAEVLYDHTVIGQLISDYIRDIEWNMTQISSSDSYFRQLSVEKFALEELLLEIENHMESAPTFVIGKFVERMSSRTGVNDGDVDFVFSVSRDAAQSILDGLYFE